MADPPVSPRMPGSDRPHPSALGIGAGLVGVAPGLGPVVLLGVWQLVALGSNLQAFVAAAVGTTAHKALLVHVIFRVLSIGLMIAGLRSFRRAEQAAA